MDRNGLKARAQRRRTGSRELAIAEFQNEKCSLCLFRFTLNKKTVPTEA
jgi:hypothetical protein